MDIDYKTLSQWLTKRMKHVPSKRKRVNTIMDIAGINHLENNWSDIYAYYFDSNANHGLGRLFIDTLNDLIAEKSHKFPLSLNNFTVKREYIAKDDKRIDLLIFNEDEAIIIENKVYANLYNPLKTYWESLDLPEENKRGVILSLHTMSISNKDFVNITHEEFAKRIELSMHKHFLYAETKSLLLLQDFIINIYNMTHAMNKEELEFYFSENNREIINRLSEIRSNVINYIKESIDNEKLINPLLQENGLKLRVTLKDNNRYTYYAFEQYPKQIMLTLVYNSLWNYTTQSRICMYLELQGDIMKYVRSNESLIKEKLGIEDNLPSTQNNWWHLEKEEIPFNIKDLSCKDSIISKIINAISNSPLYQHGLQIIECYNKTK